jgi:hypothetical protein
VRFVEKVVGNDFRLFFLAFPRLFAFLSATEVPVRRATAK